MPKRVAASLPPTTSSRLCAQHSRGLLERVLEPFFRVEPGRIQTMREQALLTKTADPLPSPMNPQRALWLHSVTRILKRTVSNQPNLVGGLCGRPCLLLGNG